MKKASLLLILIVAFYFDAKASAADAGVIGPSSITVYSGATNASRITFTTPPSGGIIVSYKWYKKTLSGWDVMPSETNDTLLFSGLTDDCLFKCVVKIMVGLAIYEYPETNEVSANVINAFQPGAIEGDEMICKGATSHLSFKTTPLGGEGAYTYQWQVKSSLIIHSLQEKNARENSSFDEQIIINPAIWFWANIAGATSATYTTPVLTGKGQYRCLVDGGAGGLPTNEFVVIMDSIKADFGLSLDTVLIGEQVDFINSSANAESYNWDFGDGNSIIEKDPIYFYHTLGAQNVRLIVTSPDGCIDTLIKNNAIVVVDVSATNTPENTMFSIYPQPANESIQFTMPVTTTATIAFYTLSGQIILQKTIMGNSSLDISELPSGSYIVRVEDKEGHDYTRKLIKE